MREEETEAVWKSLEKIRLGIVGCGAIAEQAHIPAALGSPLVEVTVLAEAQPSRLRHIQRQHRTVPFRRGRESDCRTGFQGRAVERNSEAAPGI